MRATVGVAAATAPEETVAVRVDVGVAVAVDEAAGSVLLVLRGEGGESLVMAIGLPEAGTWRVRFNSDWSGYDSAFGNHPAWDLTAQQGTYDGIPYNGTLSLGPYTAVILSQ